MVAFAVRPGTPIAQCIRCKPGPGDNAAIRYERLERKKTLLYRVVREDLEPFLERVLSTGVLVVRFVEREIRTNLASGVLAHGFLRVQRDTCGHDRLVAFS